jgi:molybdenum cofactor biosynthesis protein B
METDGGGKLVVERLTAAGHKVFRREIIPDNPEPMIALLRACESDANIQAVLLTGGTGIANRDQTFETVSGLLSKIIPGYGELFRSLSYAEIGSATILSRTVGGLMSQTVVLTMPGSPAAVALAMDKIILPEIGHLVHEANK